MTTATDESTILTSHLINAVSVIPGVLDFINDRAGNVFCKCIMNFSITLVHGLEINKIGYSLLCIAHTSSLSVYLLRCYPSTCRPYFGRSSN